MTLAELSDVTVAIGRRPVLDALDFALRAGELVALVGPNGSGKTTLLRTLVGLAPVERGTVTLGGEAVSILSARARAGRIAYLPQERRIAWNMPALEIASLGQPFVPADEARRNAFAALAELQVSHLAERGVSEMSGGERARVLIARTLVTGAHSFALDEPVAGLDPDAQFLVMDRLKSQAELGRGVVASLHDLTLAADRADKIVALKDGRVVANGPPREVFTPELLAEVFRLRGRWTGAGLQLEGRAD